MQRLAIPLSLVAAAVMAGCASPDYDTRAATPVVSSSGQPVMTGSAPAVVATPAVVTGQPVLIASGPVQAGTPIVPATNTFRSGQGTVENVAIVHITPATASAGSSSPERLAYRLTVRMDDGSLQAVDQDNRSFQVGDRVELTNDGHVVRR
ncbi:MAG: hypothetical protein JO035_03220 [Betaproteobacteria bacterium]|nr:hypothetical protein [Betaproteobacteria bacterium]